MDCGSFNVSPRHDERPATHNELRIYEAVGKSPATCSQLERSRRHECAPETALEMDP